MLHIAKDRTCAAIPPFFGALGEASCRRIQVISMDMNTAGAALVSSSSHRL
ncbi:transposase [Acidovorax sp. HDW3]|nr:transposase [Acidovorax sp. HDW3]